MTININRYKQFFTPEKYSQVLVERIDLTKKPKKIIDLTMGEGSLLKEGLKVWNEAKFFGNDIDKECCNKVKNIIPHIKCFNKDIFINSDMNFLIKHIGKVDICLGNPPFYLINQTNDSIELLKLYSLEKYYKSTHIPAEVLFILQTLKILKKNGILSVILPDGFFVNNTLTEFRKFLIRKYKILEIIELPNEIFKYTKAKTHILILQNTSPISNIIKLSHIHNNDIINITIEEAYNRMDYSFYRDNHLDFTYKKLSDCEDIKVFRGKQKFLLRDVDESWILHTTSFRNGNIFKSTLSTTSKIKQYSNRIAYQDDIIIPRVGTNILGKVGIVKSGYFVATDCVFVIRTKDIKDRENILYTLKSEFGRDWIKSISKGVGARHITLQDIANLPILEKEI